MSEHNERAATITIGGTEHELILTTKATKEIAKRYGGLENLGDKLIKSENFEMALDEICWLICLLANQSILIHNLKNKDAPRDLLTEDEVAQLFDNAVAALVDALLRQAELGGHFALRLLIKVQRINQPALVYGQFRQRRVEHVQHELVLHDGVHSLILRSLPCCFTSFPRNFRKGGSGGERQRGKPPRRKKAPAERTESSELRARR
jgi:hypothetical protein